MKKIFVKSCNVCPDFKSVDDNGDVLYCAKSILSKEDFIPPNCPLPDEPEKVKGILEINTDEDEYKWVIELSAEVDIYCYDFFCTREEARADAMEWAKKLGVEVEWH